MSDPFHITHSYLIRTINTNLTNPSEFSATCFFDQSPQLFSKFDLCQKTHFLVYKTQQRCMCDTNISYLPTKTAKVREKKYPDLLYQSGGKLFFKSIVVEHKRKLFATAKHTGRMAETHGVRQTRVLHRGQLQAIKESR